MRTGFFRRVLIALLLTAALNPATRGDGSTSAVDPFCFEAAGRAYNVSPLILWAISRAESRHNNSARNDNTNGTHDRCHMQINSWWRLKLGEERWKALESPCYCTHIGAWVLAQCVSRYGHTWEAVGCYNALSRDKRTAYAVTIYRTLTGAAGGR